MPSFNPISGAPISGGSSTGLNVSIVDALSLSDSIVSNLNYAISISSTLSFTDTLTSNWVFSRDVSSTLDFTDLVSNQMVYDRSLIDSLGLTHTLIVNHYGNTDSLHALSLSQDVSINMVRGISFYDTLSLQDIAKRTFIFDVSNTLSFTHNALKIEPEVFMTSTLVLGHSVSVGGTWHQTISSDLTFSHEIFVIKLATFVDTLNLSQSVSTRVLQQQNNSHFLSLSQALTYIVNSETYLGDNLSISDEVVVRNLQQQNTSDSLFFTYLIVTSTFPVQNPAQGLSLNQALDARYLPQCNMSSIIGIAHTIASTLFPQQNGSQNMSLGQAVSYRIFRKSNQVLADTVSITDAVAINLVSNQDLCHCLILNDKAARTFTESLENTLNLTDGLGFAQPQDWLTLSHSVVINGEFDACCGVMFLQGKFTGSTFTVAHSLTRTIDYTRSLADTLGLAQTVAYYK